MPPKSQRSIHDKIKFQLIRQAKNGSVITKVYELPNEVKNADGKANKKVIEKVFDDMTKKDKYLKEIKHEK